MTATQLAKGVKAPVHTGVSATKHYIDRSTGRLSLRANGKKVIGSSLEWKTKCKPPLDEFKSRSTILKDTSASIGPQKLKNIVKPHALYDSSSQTESDRLQTLKNKHFINSPDWKTKSRPSLDKFLPRPTILAEGSTYIGPNKSKRTIKRNALYNLSDQAESNGAQVLKCKYLYKSELNHSSCIQKSKCGQEIPADFPIRNHNKVDQLILSNHHKKNTLVKRLYDDSLNDFTDQKDRIVSHKRKKSVSEDELPELWFKTMKTRHVTNCISLYGNDDKHNDQTSTSNGLTLCKVEKHMIPDQLNDSDDSDTLPDISHLFQSSLCVHRQERKRPVDSTEQLGTDYVNNQQLLANVVSMVTDSETISQDNPTRSETMEAVSDEKTVPDGTDYLLLAYEEKETDYTNHFLRHIEIDMEEELASLKPILKQIVRGKIQCNRHDMFFGTRAERAGLQHITGVRHWSDHLLDKAANTLLNWFCPSGKGIPVNLDRVAYVLDVLMPEALNLLRIKVQERKTEKKKVL